MIHFRIYDDAKPSITLKFLEIEMFTAKIDLNY